ncbi:MAG TPA: energy-coupling factor transporter transmembrane component T [Anaerolineae bacterium]|nr:energy-coupling factor transporter transmembrane component T [Anaerolineae bacterium]
MSYELDPYVPGDSWLHRLDPRVKLWGVVVGCFTAFWLRDLWWMLVLLGLIHLLFAWARLPWRKLRELWQQMALLVLLILLLQPLFRPEGEVLLAWGAVRLTTGGLYGGALIALRALSLAFILALLLLTTAQPSLVRALVRLGLPYTWGVGISLTLRFVPAIYALFVAVREAQAARGWQPDGHPLRRARGYLPVLVAVIIGTLRLSDQLTLALAARGFGDARPRTVWHDLRMRGSDWLGLALLSLILTVVFSR